jgi:hypothetical protein
MVRDKKNRGMRPPGSCGGLGVVAKTILQAIALKSALTPNWIGNVL